MTSRRADDEKAMASVVLSVVIPAFNEAQNVGPVVRELIDVLSNDPGVSSYEIILVDDGSTDGTLAELARLEAMYSGITVLRHPTNLGFGAALRTGYDAAVGEFVTLTTSDGEFDPREVIQLFHGIGDADLMLSRRERAPQVSSSSRSLLSAGFQACSRFLLGFDPSELMGVYVIRRDVLRRFELRSNTGMMNTELQMMCFAAGCQVRYGILTVRPRLSGESKVANLPTLLKVLYEMIRLRYRSRR